MADQTKEDKPLAPALIQFQYHSDNYDDESMLLSEPAGWRQNYVKCCGCVMAILSILAVVALVLTFTVFHIKDPSIIINNIELANGTLHEDTNTNTTLVADVSIKNPNAGTFKFHDGQLTIYYGDTVVGEARTPPGKAKAEATIHMNVTVGIIPSKLLAIPSFSSEIKSGALRMSTKTMVGGKVRVIKIISQYVLVKTNRSMTYYVSSQTFQVGH